jgi:hypothetical protein
LNDEGQQQMAGVAQQEAPDEPQVRAAQQEAPEVPKARGAQLLESKEADDQPQVTYKLVEF